MVKQCLSVSKLGLIRSDGNFKKIFECSLQALAVEHILAILVSLF